jgi:hypothetical protein
MAGYYTLFMPSLFQCLKNGSGQLNKWVVILGVVVGILLIIGIIASGFHEPFTLWIIIQVLLVVCLILIGCYMSKRPGGILIDDRFKMSLSNFQMTMWTVIVLSALGTVYLYNIWIQYSQHAAVTEALSVNFPLELLVLMGISAASLAGAKLVLISKDNNPPPEELKKDVIARLGNLYGFSDPDKNVTFSSIIHRNKQMSDARVGNMFNGDQIADCTTIDLGKVQMFFFTVILGITYTVAIGTLFLSAPAGKMISSMPAFSDSMLLLISISHAGYLSLKAQNKTPQLLYAPPKTT